MKYIILAFDKFKGSATSLEITDAASLATHQACADAAVVSLPLADGGDGTMAALAATSPGRWVQVSAADASYYLCENGTAYIEVAEADGLARVPADKRDVMHASTLGTGTLIADAISRKCSQVVLGLGGSASCDGGMGIMAALGAEFVDAQGHLLPPCGASMSQVAQIDTSGIDPAVLGTPFTLLADVNNPLCGDNGSAAVYAPQKGATPDQVQELERGLQHLATVVGAKNTDEPGMGAAGGVPLLMTNLLNCKMVPGARYVLEQDYIDHWLSQGMLVITGEGRLDATSFMGKATGTVARMAADYGVPVVAICGSVAHDEVDAVAHGLFDQIIDLMPASGDMNEAMEPMGTLQRLGDAVRQVVKQYCRRKKA